MRLSWIDNTKGLGILLVVYAHVLIGINNSTLEIDPKFFSTNVSIIYSFHMPLFFILSGLFFENSFQKYGLKKFIIIKSKTILYPFIIWSLIQTSIEVLFSAYTNNILSSSEILLSLIYPRSIFWFLFALFFINIINSIFQWIFTKKYLIISLIISILLHFIDFDFGIFHKTLTNLIYFNIGILLSRYLKSNELKFKVSYSLVLSVLFLLFYFYFQTLEFGKVLVNFILAILGFSFVVQIGLFIQSNFSKNIFEFLGRNSMIIFLTHLLFTVGSRIVLQKIFSIESISIHLIVGTSFGLLFPIVFYTVVKRFNASSWLFEYPRKTIL